MRNRFHTDLDALTEDVIEMGNLICSMLDRSVTAYANGDREMADWVLQNKDEASRLDSLIEDEALRLLVLHQPMAGDMRRIATILKMITYMERIGRYAKNIANAANDLMDSDEHKPMPQISTMGAVAIEMVRDSLMAFETSNVRLVEDFASRDDELDRMRYDYLRTALAEMKACACNVDTYTSYLMVARYLERCGDNACKIAEKVHYMVTGKRIDLR